MEKLWDELNVSSLNHTFGNFKKRQGTEKAFCALSDLTKGKSDRKFFLLYGERGTGKTHLIEATIIAWRENKVRARYTTTSDIIRNLKQGLKNGANPDYDARFRNYCEINKLVIDDYGMGTQETKFEVADIEDIIDKRYQRRYRDDEKVTILATNNDIKNLPDRIVSRFFDPEFGAVVFMDTTDYRRSKENRVK